MSYKRILICDICGREISNYEGSYKAYLTSVCEDESIDICKSCFDFIKVLVKEKGEDE